MKNSRNKNKTDSGSKGRGRKQDGGIQEKDPISLETKKVTSSVAEINQEALQDTLSCKICERTFIDEDDELLECERCQEWICRECAGLSVQQYSLINEAGIGLHFHWYCHTCKDAALKAVRTDNDIEEWCKNFMESFGKEIREEMKEEVKAVKLSLEKKIKDEIDTVNQRIDSINLGAIGTDTKQQEDEKTEAMLEEMKEREIRKHNLVIFNLEESKATDPEDRKQEDQEAIRKLLAKIQTPVPFSKAV
eukprot:gene10395-11479_t